MFKRAIFYNSKNMHINDLGIILLQASKVIKAEY